MSVYEAEIIGEKKEKDTIPRAECAAKILKFIKVNILLCWLAIGGSFLPLMAYLINPFYGYLLITVVVIVGGIFFYLNEKTRKELIQKYPQ
jgi:hypothetical protein